MSRFREIKGELKGASLVTERREHCGSCSESCQSDMDKSGAAGRTVYFTISDVLPTFPYSKLQ